MSRGQALRSITLESFERKMAGIVADTGRDLLDEAPHAYKNLDTVVEQQRDLVAPLGRLLPLVNVKGSGRWQEPTAEQHPARPSPTRRDRTRDKDDPLQRRKLARRGRG